MDTQRILLSNQRLDQLSYLTIKPTIGPTVFHFLMLQVPFSVGL